MQTTINIDLQLDATGLICPIPIAKTKQAMSKLSNNQVLLVAATDPSFAIDCQVYIRQSGNKLLKSWQDNVVYYYLLRKN